jgi:hypothetical protein
MPQLNLSKPFPEVCETCRFYSTKYPDRGCHRHAPVALAETKLPVWPLVSHDDSCGDWELGPIKIEGDNLTRDGLFMLTKLSK